MTLIRWYQRPEGPALLLRKTPRLATWNKSTDPDQIRLWEYLDDTADLVSSHPLADGPSALWLDVGLPDGRDVIDMADLDNYAYPLAARLCTEHLVSVWCSKRHAAASYVTVAPARAGTAPDATYAVRTSASSQTTRYKEQVRAGVASAPELPAGPVRLQIAFVVGARRNWLNLWKPTIDALDPLLGRTRADRDWHPQDGRIIELGLHLTIDAGLANDVVLTIAAEPAS
jgi:hypothetical protein